MGRALRCTFKKVQREMYEGDVQTECRVGGSHGYSKGTTKGASSSAGYRAMKEGMADLHANTKA